MNIRAILIYVLLTYDKPSTFFESLTETDLNAHFKELNDLKTVEQNPKNHPEGSVWNHTMMVIDEAAKLKYESLFQKNGIVAKFSKSKGLIPFLRKYEKRYGIFLGALFLLLSVYASSLFVWRIDIEGNKNVPDEEIILQLENAAPKPQKPIRPSPAKSIPDAFLKIHTIVFNFETASATLLFT